MPDPIAITRAVSPALGECELTYLPRVPIDVDVARAQHRAYEQALAEAGYRVEHLDADATMPDSVFVEDMAVVFDEVAILTHPGAESRRREMPAIAAALAAHRPLQQIQPPATVDGGDVLVAGRTVFVGRSTRTNDAALAQIRRILGPFGYTVSGVDVRGCLHLKSAVTALADDRAAREPGVDRCVGVRRASRSSTSLPRSRPRPTRCGSPIESSPRGRFRARRIGSRNAISEWTWWTPASLRRRRAR